MNIVKRFLRMQVTICAMKRRANHLPVKRRKSSIVANFDETLQVFKCSSSSCNFTSNKKSNNTIRHIKRCTTIINRKLRVEKNRKCNFVIQHLSGNQTGIVMSATIIRMKQFHHYLMTWLKMISIKSSLFPRKLSMI